jgi:hypothetical protein
VEALGWSMVASRKMFVNLIKSSRAVSAAFKLSTCRAEVSPTLTGIDPSPYFIGAQLSDRGLGAMTQKAHVQDGCIDLSGRKVLSACTFSNCPMI